MLALRLYQLIEASKRGNHYSLRLIKKLAGLMNNLVLSVQVIDNIVQIYSSSYVFFRTGKMSIGLTMFCTCWSFVQGWGECYSGTRFAQNDKHEYTRNIVLILLVLIFQYSYSYFQYLPQPCIRTDNTSKSFWLDCSHEIALNVTRSDDVIIGSGNGWVPELMLT